MTKEEYNKNRPRVQCPICKKYFTKAVFNKHYIACANPESKLNRKGDIYITTNNTLNCLFCSKLLKNFNALVQHELRCKNNPNRRNFNALGEYSHKHNLGTTKYDNIIIQKQLKTKQQKIENGYVSPLRGKHKPKIHYKYKEHNLYEIQKWLDYIDAQKIQIPQYKVCVSQDPNRYVIVSGKQTTINSASYVKYEQVYLMEMLFDAEELKTYTIHHINYNKQDNSLHNLLVFKTQKDHLRYHELSNAYLVYDDIKHIFTCEIHE